MSDPSIQGHALASSTCPNVDAAILEALLPFVMSSAEV
jgi:hypothetical protein